MSATSLQQELKTNSGLNIPDGRDCYLDFLRGLGLLLLVVAHTSPAPLFHTLRTFDVPLMVVVSAVCFKSLRGGYLTISRKE